MTKPKTTDEANEPAEDIKSLNLYERLHRITAGFDRLEKDGQVQGGGRYAFTSHDHVVSRLRPLLRKYRVQPIASVEEWEQQDKTALVRMVVEFVNIDKPEDRVSVRGIGMGMDSQDKGPGKAVSYATKYALLKMFCGSTGEDTDYGESPLEAPSAQRSIKHAGVEQSAKQRAVGLVRAWSGVTETTEIQQAVRDVARVVGVSVTSKTTEPQWAKVADAAESAVADGVEFTEFVKGASK